MKACLIVAVLSAVAMAGAQAQTAAEENVTDPAARVPAVSYRSAFEDYVSYREPAIAPWREVNDEVARAGGHAGILRAAPEEAKENGPRAKPAIAQPVAGANGAGGQAPRAAPEAPEGKPAPGAHHGH